MAAARRLDIRVRWPMCLSQCIFQIGGQSLGSAEIQLFLDATFEKSLLLFWSNLGTQHQPPASMSSAQAWLRRPKTSWCWGVCGREGVGWSLTLWTTLIIISLISRSRSECTQTYTHRYTCTLHRKFRGEHNPSNIYMCIYNLDILTYMIYWWMYVHFCEPLKKKLAEGGTKHWGRRWRVEGRWVHFSIGNLRQWNSHSRWRAWYIRPTAQTLGCNFPHDNHTCLQK